MYLPNDILPRVSNIILLSRILILNKSLIKEIAFHGDQSEKTNIAKGRKKEVQLKIQCIVER